MEMKPPEHYGFKVQLNEKQNVISKYAFQTIIGERYGLCIISVFIREQAINQKSSDFFSQITENYEKSKNWQGVFENFF